MSTSIPSRVVCHWSNCYKRALISQKVDLCLYLLVIGIHIFIINSCTICYPLENQSFKKSFRKVAVTCKQTQMSFNYNSNFLQHLLEIYKCKTPSVALGDCA